MLFALAAAPDMFSEQVRSSLRRDIPGVVLGILLLAVGLGAVALFRLRARGKDPALLWFGIFAGLYGLRLLLTTDVMPFLAAPIPRRFWAYLAAAVTYAILLPGFLFAREIFPAWSRVLRWLVRRMVVFSVAGIVLDLFLRRPGSLFAVNGVIVLSAFLALLAALFRTRVYPAELRMLRAAILILSATVLFENLRGLSGLTLPVNPEPFGMAIFIGALGHPGAVRTIANQERLAAIEKELDIARRIQMSILPRELPRTSQVSIAARYLPMTSVAGDFYDFLILDDRRLGILVADVSGHGVPAALIASMVKVAIASQLPHADDPALVLTGMNRTLCGKLQGQFVTAAYLFLDVGALRMRYAAAGHPPLLRWRHEDGSIEEVQENGLPLGLMPVAAYTFTERSVERSDKFLLYTDGLTEATNGTEEYFGDERVRKTLSGCAALPADECATTLLDALARWAGHDRGRPQEGDLTVVIVDVR